MLCHNKIHKTTGCDYKRLHTCHERAESDQADQARVVGSAETSGW